ncbi:hypothetical protein IGI04_018360 [Brassica rapa subsp. trilocularis]|nr:hypothetical protein IGI04_018360 [Brassica rapa subsp. trilocularis]
MEFAINVPPSTVTLKTDVKEIDKRVRFSYDIRDDNSTGGYRDSAMETSSPEERVVQLLHPYGVPDYVRNPSKYIRYKFDEGEVDEESNRKAYMELLNMIRSRDEHLVELPTSVAFVPKRKPTGERKVGNTDKSYEGRRGEIAVEDNSWLINKQWKKKS